MSTSETITRTDLANILNEVLPLNPWITQIKTKSFTGTTDGYGNLSLGLSQSDSAQVICVVGSNYVYVPFVYSNNWYAKVVSSNSSHTPIVSESVSVTVSYTQPSTVTATDYIVEQGTSGIWTYRKWNSGIAECWGKTSVASTTYSANGGYKNVTESLPSGLFNAIPSVVNASGKINTCVQTHIGFTAPNDATSIQTYLVNRNSSSVTQAGEVYWEVKGTWK